MTKGARWTLVICGVASFLAGMTMSLEMLAITTVQQQTSARIGFVGCAIVFTLSIGLYAALNVLEHIYDRLATR